MSLGTKWELLLKSGNQVGTKQKNRLPGGKAVSLTAWNHSAFLVGVDGFEPPTSSLGIRQARPYLLVFFGIKREFSHAYGAVVCDVTGPDFPPVPTEKWEPSGNQTVRFLPFLTVLLLRNIFLFKFGEFTKHSGFGAEVFSNSFRRFLDGRHLERRNNAKRSPCPELQRKDALKTKQSGIAINVRNCGKKTPLTYLAAEGFYG